MRTHAPAVRFTLAPRQATVLWLAGLVALALLIRLAAWHWHEFYPLGGDEREYLAQALTLLRERRYVELPLMRPPLYTLFLAAAIRVVDSLVQNLRLVQAVLSALTVLPLYAFTRELCGSRRVALLAGALFACDYTLALAATELLTETVFVFSLTTCLWLVLRAARTPFKMRDAILAGVVLGCLVLIRSVALPLLILGAAWLLVRRARKAGRVIHMTWAPALAFVLATLVIVLPWTGRNLATYHALILVDTTGAENLWLDNDPAGREAVKRQLYALGDDRGLRQQLATRRGVEVIVSDPARFVAKAWGEAQRLFALQHFDDMRSRPEIWVPPAEVALRLTLGDGVWLLVLIGGIAGMWLYRPPTSVSEVSFDPRWILALWSLYVVATSLLFHVELRYRLPLVPALLPYCAWLLAAPGRCLWPVSATRMASTLLSCCAVVALMLLHRPYLAESAMLARKHIALWNAAQALQRGDAQQAREQAKHAIEADPETALGYVATALAWLYSGNTGAASEAARTAERAMPAHPLPHLVLGALARQAGDMEAAREEFAYEASSLQDLQQWSWQAFAPFAVPPTQLALGDGLDLGFVRGFTLPEDNMRWTRAQSELRLSTRPGVRVLRLELASGRPAGQPQPRVLVRWNGQELASLSVAPEWAWYELPLPAPSGGQAATALITLYSDTFRPRDLDHASPDGRTLGVMMRHAEVVP